VDIWAEWPIPNDAVDVSAGAPNLESYTNGGDGTVLDAITGLAWQEVPSSTALSWGSAATSGTAQAYCATASTGGHDDWRLPSLVELLSITDHSTQNPAIDSSAFSGTPGAEFWSSTPLAGSPGNAWLVNFLGGGTGPDATTAAHFARCVRGSSPSAGIPRYAAANGTVYDAQTKLTWQEAVPSGTYAWGAATTSGTAQSYCAGLSLNGTGWRLPTVGELGSLVDFAQVGGLVAMIDPTYFAGTVAGEFWSLTPFAGASDSWTVSFSQGATGHAAMSTKEYVRCVR
jgi:hypothetical protein